MKRLFFVTFLAISVIFGSGVTEAGASQGPAFFALHNDTIPNFAQNPTIQTAQHGSWASASTWNPARLPQDGDVVLITHDVTYNSMNGEATTIGIDANGSLRFVTNQSTLLKVGTLLVMPGGYIEVGTEANPIADGVTAEILIKDVPLDLTDNGNGIFDPFQFGTSLLVVNGTITMHGTPKSPTFMRLNEEPLAGMTTLRLEQSTNWKLGDRVVLPDTRQLNWNEDGKDYQPQWEEHTIASISGDGKTITLTAPLQFNHRGAHDGDNNIRFLPHVANLSRNVSIRSENPSGTRGHTQAFHRSNVDIRYVQFRDLGRTTNNPLDNTTVNGSGTVTKIGTNQIARYPLHTHHLIGPETTPANGYQFTLIGNSVDGGSNDHNHKWGITIHGSHYGLIKYNTIYNMFGAGVAFEDGSESYNVLEQNFAMRVLGTGSRADKGCGSDCGREGVGFWFHGPNNYVRDNVAASMPDRYGYTLFNRYTGAHDIPAFKGANPHMPGQATTVDMNKIPILEFSGNEVYGACFGGLTYWWIGTTAQTAHVVAPSTIKDFRAWNVTTGMYGYQSHRLTLLRTTIIGDKNVAPKKSTFGLFFSDYLQQDLTIDQADIQNMRTGIDAPIILGPRNETNPRSVIIKNSLLQNYYGINVIPPWHNNNAVGLSPTEIRVHNTRVKLWNGGSAGSNKPSYPGIKMGFSSKPMSNVIVGSTVHVYDHNGIPGNDFQVFYPEQQPDAIVPENTFKNGKQKLVGSPVSGLTNTQTMATYGIANAGAITSCLDNTSQPGFRGFTCPNGSNPPPLDTIPPAAPIGLLVM